MTITMRTCQRCGNEYQPTGSRQEYCAECGSAAKAERHKVCTARWDKNNPEKRKAKDSKWKKANPDKIRAATVRWQKENPDRVKANVARWRKANSLRVKEYDTKRYAANPEKGRAYSAEYRQANPEKVKETQHNWRQVNPEIRAIQNSKYRDAKYANTPINELLTSTEWLAILSMANGHCHYCGKEAKLTLDHVIPLSKGGKHSIDNVVPACLHCNSSKGARTPEQWLQSLITGGGSDASKSVREQSLVLEGD